MFVFWAFVIAGLVLLVRYLAHLGRAGGHAHSSLEILKQRYARGEIQKDEFEAKRRDLS
jgi:putative membrane protein